MAEKTNVEILIEIIREMTAASRDQEAALRDVVRALDELKGGDTAKFKIMRRLETFLDDLKAVETQEIEDRRDRRNQLSKWVEDAASSRPVQVALEVGLLAGALWVAKILGVLKWIAE